MRLMLLKDLIESTNRRWQTNKKQLTSDTILITTNAMHVFRTIFPHIYKCNATRMKKKKHTNKQTNNQTYNNLQTEQGQNKTTTKLATPNFRNGYAPGKRKQKSREKKNKASPPSARNQNKKPIKMNENQTRLLGSFSLRINMWSSSCHYY